MRRRAGLQLIGLYEAEQPPAVIAILSPAVMPAGLSALEKTSSTILSRTGRSAVAWKGAGAQGQTIERVCIHIGSKATGRATGTQEPQEWTVRCWKTGGSRQPLR